MSKEIAPSAAKALELQKQNMAERLQGLSTGDAINRIRLDNRHFVMPDETRIKGELPVVILDWAYSNTYYSKPWTPGADTFPDCFAVGQTQANMVPSQNSPNIQNDGNPCATCPHNQFGSAPNGKGKACQNRVQLAVMLFTDDGGPEDGFHIVSISPTGLKAWGKYVTALSQRGLAPAQVVTVLQFNESVTWDSLLFTADKDLTKEYHDDGYFEEYVEHLGRATEIVLSEPKPPEDE